MNGEEFKIIPKENIDKTLYYHELLLTYDNTSKYEDYKLPSNFSYTFYEDGDVKDWIDIHISSKEFSNYEKALQYFHDFFDYFKDELNRRCIFIKDNITGLKVATATVSKLKKDEYGYEAAIDFVAVRKEYQGRHLSKPLISRIIKLSKDLGYDKVILHTQTHTWLAVKIYLDMGFNPFMMEKNYTGWQIIKTITQHQKLSFLNNLSYDKLYSKTAKKIYNKLKQIYNGDFNYTIWYKDGLNMVYVLQNNKEHIFKYYSGFEDVYLEKIK